MSETIGFKGILDMPNNVKLSRLETLLRRVQS